MTASAAHTALLLAAGGSRRLGQSKQALLRQGTPLIRHMAGLALATSPARLVVVLGAQADAHAQALAGLPVVTVDNPAWANGMGSSLQVGVQALADITAPMLVLGVDQPALDAAHLHALLAAFDGHRDVASGYAGILGVPAVLRPETLACVDQLDGDRGFGTLLRAALPAPQVIANEALALDIDSPRALVQAQALGWLDALQ